VEIMHRAAKRFDGVLPASTTPPPHSCHHRRSMLRPSST
jgi:hypothetical protein